MPSERTTLGPVTTTVLGLAISHGHIAPLWDRLISSSWKTMYLTAGPPMTAQMVGDSSRGLTHSIPRLQLQPYRPTPLEAGKENGDAGHGKFIKINLMPLAETT